MSVLSFNIDHLTKVVNPRCTFAVRVTVVGPVCVCLLLNISLLE